MKMLSRAVVWIIVFVMTTMLLYLVLGWTIFSPSEDPVNDAAAPWWVAMLIAAALAAAFTGLIIYKDRQRAEREREPPKPRSRKKQRHKR